MRTDIAVMLVAQTATKAAARMLPYDFDADRPSKESLDAIQNVLGENFQTRFVELQSFNPAQVFKNEIVFPLWQGGASRNRTALIPAICELNGLKFVGADAFVQSSCQDKNFSKLVAKSFGIGVPAGEVLLSPENIPALKDMSFPAVVKPIYGGSSIGMTEKNLCYDSQSAREATMLLFEKGLGPVLVEEFVQGEEYYVSIISKHGRISEVRAVKWLTKEGKSFLSNRIFDFDLKVNWDADLVMTDATPELPVQLIAKLEQICHYFSPIDILRCDFRGVGDDMQLIEFTPDMNLALDAEFVGGFAMQGKSYSDIFSEIIDAALEKYPGR